MAQRFALVRLKTMNFKVIKDFEGFKVFKTILVRNKNGELYGSPFFYQVFDDYCMPETAISRLIFDTSP